MGTNYYICEDKIIQGKHICKVSRTKRHNIVYWSIHPLDFAVMADDIIVIDEYGYKMSYAGFMNYVKEFIWDFVLIGKEFW